MHRSASSPVPVLISVPATFVPLSSHYICHPTILPVLISMWVPFSCCTCPTPISSQSRFRSICMYVTAPVLSRLIHSPQPSLSSSLSISVLFPIPHSFVPILINSRPIYIHTAPLHSPSILTSVRSSFPSLFRPSLSHSRPLSFPFPSRFHPVSFCDVWVLYAPLPGICVG